MSDRPSNVAMRGIFIFFIATKISKISDNETTEAAYVDSQSYPPSSDPG